jgi:hypothetical protein
MVGTPSIGQFSKLGGQTRVGAALQRLAYLIGVMLAFLVGSKPAPVLASVQWPCQLHHHPRPHNYHQGFPLRVHLDCRPEWTPMLTVCVALV